MRLPTRDRVRWTDGMTEKVDKKTRTRTASLVEWRKWRKGSNRLCLVHYPWKRPEHIRGLIEDALWPRDTKRGHGQSLCSIYTLRSCFHTSLTLSISALFYQCLIWTCTTLIDTCHIWTDTPCPSPIRHVRGFGPSLPSLKNPVFYLWLVNLQDRCWP